MLADPQSVTINGSAVSLPRVGNTANGGVYQASTGLVRLNLAHTPGRSRTRRAFKLTQDAYSADPLVPAQNLRASMSVWLGVDVPSYGFTTADQGYLIAALLANLQANTSANIGKFLGGES